MKRILIGSTLIVAGIIGVAGATPASAEQANLGVCQPQDAHIDPGEDVTEVKVDAPAGKLISGYCVKSGSINQELGPEYRYFDPPVPSVTITYTKSPTEKDISHYIVFYVKGAVPVKPPSTAPTCDAEGTVEVLEDTEFYTYDYALEDGVMTVSVTPTEGSVLSGYTVPWTYPIAKLTAKPDGTPCATEPVVESDPPVIPSSPPVAPVAPADRPPALPAAPVVAAAGPAPAQPVPTQLPSTGTSSWWLAMVAMGLVLAGSGFVSFGRRPS